MARVLHLLGRTADFQATQASSILAGRGSADMEILRHQLSGTGRERLFITKVLALRERVRDVDIIHAFGSEAIALAPWVASGRRMILSFSELSGRRQIEWLARIVGHGGTNVVCGSAAQRQHLLKHGLPEQRCRVIVPAVDATSIATEADTRLRESLGFVPDDIVLLAPGESSRPAAHREVLWTASILHVFDSRYRLLIWGRGEQTPALAALAGKLRQPRLLTVAEERLRRPIEFDALAHVADMVLATASPAAAPLPLAICMAAGRPIVGSADGLARSMLVNGKTAALVPHRLPRLLAQRVLELRNERELSRSISCAATIAARAEFGVDRFVGEYSHLYQEVSRGDRVSPRSASHHPTNVEIKELRPL